MHIKKKGEINSKEAVKPACPAASLQEFAVYRVLCFTSEESHSAGVGPRNL